MKVWVSTGNSALAKMYGIPSFIESGGEVTKAWITPTKEDPAQLIPSNRDDGYEEIKWHGEVHLVYSIDLEHEK